MASAAMSLIPDYQCAGVGQDRAVTSLLTRQKPKRSSRAFAMPYTEGPESGSIYLVLRGRDIY